MTGSNGRLGPAPDDHSGGVLAYKTMERPRSGPGAGNTGYGAGPTHNSDEGADMAKRTRGFPGSDSETRISAVTITPVSSVSATVPTTRSVA